MGFRNILQASLPKSNTLLNLNLGEIRKQLESEHIANTEKFEFLLLISKYLLAYTNIFTFSRAK